MIRPITVLYITLVVISIWQVEGWLSSSGRRRGTGASNTQYRYDISTTTGLRRLYNARVVRAERWKRPLASSANSNVARYLGLEVKCEVYR